MLVQLTESSTYLFDNVLHYNKRLFEKNTIDATVVYGLQTFDQNRLVANGKNAPSDVLGYYGLSGTADADNSVTYTPLQWGKIYYVGRLTYGYDSRYNVTLSMRRDGSSRFGSNNKWGDFPSVSFAWNGQNESFIKDIAAISILKYRVSYGIMGNDRIPDYSFVSLTQGTTYPFNQTVLSGLTTGTFGNQSVRWEKSAQFNTGFDFGFLKNRINGSFDYYNSTNSDLLLPEQIPSTSGFTSTISNVGETKNWGAEVTLGAIIIDSKFKWKVDVNWSFDRNKIVKLTRSQVDANGNPINDIPDGWFIGKDIHEIYDYKFLGIYQKGDTTNFARMYPSIKGYGIGDPKIEDANHDGKITAADMTYIGSPTPKWYGGFKNTFSYAGFEFSVLFETVQGGIKNDAIFAVNWPWQSGCSKLLDADQPIQ